MITPPCASGTREELGQEQQLALLAFVSMMEIWLLAAGFLQVSVNFGCYQREQAG